MTEEEAREDVARMLGPEIARVERFITMLTMANATQNLVSASSLPHVWERHILDSAQLAPLARDGDRHWGDIGSGAGFPGLVVAMFDRFDVTLIEPRRRRADFLQSCIELIGLRNVSVVAKSAEHITGVTFDIVSARAVAPTESLLAMSRGLAKPSTRFIFPKGERAAIDVETAQREWHGVFHVEQSRTSPTSGIVVIDQVRPK